MFLSGTSRRAASHLPRLFLVTWRVALFCCLSLQGSPGLPSLAALHSNQILTVKVCLVEFCCRAAQSDPPPRK